MENIKRCPYCGEEILAIAKKCKHCGEWLEPKETPKVKKPCPICGEMIDEDFNICIYCKEPINEGGKNGNISNPTVQENVTNKKESVKAVLINPCKSYILLALLAVILGNILSFANDFAQEYRSEVGGLVGLFIDIGRAIPAWIGSALDGAGTIFLLWSIANSIRKQAKTEGRDNEATSLLLKTFSFLYFTCNFIACFAEENIIPVVFLFVPNVLLVILMVFSGIVLKYEEDLLLAKIGKAFIFNFIIIISNLKFMFRTNYDPTVFLSIGFLCDVIWIYIMHKAYKYLLRNNVYVTKCP